MVIRFMPAAFLALGMVALSWRVGLAVEIAPASVQDILQTMGPDAEGLTLTPESLPDLFILTSRSVEKNAEQYIVEQPYMSGRWKGGKAVIEYARDLTYTLVSVYDKEGTRQRLFSVSTKFTESVQRLKAMPRVATTHKKPRASPPVQSIPVASMPASVRSSMESTPSSEMEISPKGKEASTAPTGGETAVSYEWDEEKGSYVPVKTVIPPPIIEATVAQAVPTQVMASNPASVSPSAKPTETMAAEKTETPPAPKQERRKSTRKHKKTAPAAAKVQVGNTTWVERTSGDQEEPPSENEKSETAPQAKGSMGERRPLALDTRTEAPERRNGSYRPDQRGRLL